ncbi:hypothetical protein QJS04_geneDACA016099 [Acorus gramineus]|uniref:Uncharacterized protein n=1 Tax=Acorus gramineus TaxID=55184 RepID=A0AAV9BIV4_ACOGR|nr:hypothetical protein QJS04_geneDACA016099 [Acorus gramineus]
MTIVERGEEYHITFVSPKSTVGATIYISPRRQCRIPIVEERNEGDGGDGGLGRRTLHRLKGSESLALRGLVSPVFCGQYVKRFGDSFIERGQNSFSQRGSIGVGNQVD